MRMYSAIADSFTGPSPIVLRAVLPVEMPKSTRPGASAFTEASAFAATGAMRLLGISTPVAETDLRCDHRRGRHADEDIGIQHMRVEEPDAAIAEFLGALDDLPAIGRRGEVDADIHGARLRPWLSPSPRAPPPP